MKVLLVRHGQTSHNAEGRLLGRADPTLTETGRMQAAALGAALAAVSPVSVVASPLVRARETAVAIAEAAGAPLRVDERWIELDYGEWDGLRFDELPTGVARRWRDDASVRPPGGETLGDVRARVTPACAALLDGDGPTVVVSHVSPIKAAVCWALDVGDERSWRMRLDLASVTRLAGSARHPVLLAFNETGHLTG